MFTLEERRKSGEALLSVVVIYAMNSTDERIWRAVIVSVGAASISQETLTEPENVAMRYIISVSHIVTLLRLYSQFLIFGHK